MNSVTDVYGAMEVSFAKNADCVWNAVLKTQSRKAAAAQNTVCWMVHGKNTSVKSAEAVLMIVTNAMFADCV